MPNSQSQGAKLPSVVRYVKNGRSGRWWQAAKDNSQVHGGWSGVPVELIERVDLAAIRALPTEQRGNTQDFNALSYLIDRPSQYLWITFEEGSMWWCTVHDQVIANPKGESHEQGHFWLTCDRPWNCQSLGGRHLAISSLPGSITKTASFRATVCEPERAPDVLRIIRDETDPDVAGAHRAREAYERAIATLVARLQPRDFELLIDLLLARDGWARIAELGGTREGIDIEVENIAASEIAFVQVKSVASQAVLDDYVERFRAQRNRYARMIFAVHSPTGHLKPPPAEPVQVWDRPRISHLVVRHGLGAWLAGRL